jgi:hypothetical protein
MRSDGARLRKVPPARRRADSVHWLFRSNNIPHRRRSLLPGDIRKRNFFRMGEVVAVLFNVRLPLCIMYYVCVFILFLAQGHSPFSD